MRWGVLILLGVFFVSFASATVPTTCHVDTDAYWQFENNLLDGVGTYDTGVWTGTASYNNAIKVGKAAGFTGSQKITIPANSLIFNGAFTIEFWLSDYESSSASLLKKGEYEIKFVSGGDVVANAGAVEVTSSGIGIYAPVHIALVWNANTPPYNLVLYVDGVKVDEAVLASAKNAGGSIILGDGFTGLIDELAIYGSALPESVIDLHYALGNSKKDYCDESGADGGSLTRTDFNIRGCTFEMNDDLIGVSKGRCSGEPAQGYFFCGVDQEGPLEGGWATTGADDFWSLGCAMGNPDWQSGENFCCPYGNNYFCDENGTSNLFRCVRRTANCEDMLTEEECIAEEMGCIWWDDSICIPNLDGYSCSDYDNELDCNNDNFNLGLFGVGTEFCGTNFECVGIIFSVIEDDCNCVWYDTAPEGSRCQVGLIGSQMFFDPDNPDNQNKFSCSNVYTLDECIEGKQNVTWISNSSIISGFSDYTSVPEECLDALNCNNGEGKRSCGEPIVKLPGFSLFAFFASLFIVGMYYKKEVATGHTP